MLRIDDLDGPRVKAAAAEAAIEDLQWLGLDWDEGPTYQTTSLAPYTDALAELHAAGWIYPCSCTRSQIEAASAPQDGVHELRYPGTCRDSADRRTLKSPPVLEPADFCWRVKTTAGASEFFDEFAGPQSCDIHRQVGDFQVTTKNGLPSYQLAAVVDDSEMGITDIVRGDDLIDSTFRQDYLRGLLDLPCDLRHWHLPIVVGEDGRRLAKRHGDSRICHFRESGVSAERILGLLHSWCGGSKAPITARALLEELDVEQIPKDRVVMTAEDHRWLLDD